MTVTYIDASSALLVIVKLVSSMKMIQINYNMKQMEIGLANTCLITSSRSSPNVNTSFFLPYISVKHTVMLTTRLTTACNVRSSKSALFVVFQAGFQVVKGCLAQTVR